MLPSAKICEAALPFATRAEENMWRREPLRFF
jgi:hypothetical protein